MKFHDIDISDAVIAAGGSITQASCNIIAQGVTESERIGRKCNIKRINWKFKIALPTTAVAASTSDTVRVVLYHDKQTNGAAATVANIFEIDNFQSYRNLANGTRFNILMDRTYSVACPSGSGRGSTDTLSFGEALAINDTFYKSCNIPIEFDAATGAITEQRTNNIGVLLFSLSGLAAFDSQMRIRFSDS